MKALSTKFLCGIVAVGLVAAFSALASASTMYAMGRSGDVSTLLTVTPSPFSTTVVGSSNAGRFAGLAFDPVSGTLYASSGNSGTDFDSLFTIDPANGAATLVGLIDTNSELTTDLAIDNSGTIFGTDFANLYSINPASGLGTNLGSFVNSTSMEAIAVDPTTDILYGIDFDDADFYSINKATGLATLLGTFTGGVLNDDITGLGIDFDGTIYASHGSGSGEIFTLNLTTFTSTSIGTYGGGSVSDITFLIPEPSTFALVGVALIGLVAIRKRR